MNQKRKHKRIKINKKASGALLFLISIFMCELLFYVCIRVESRQAEFRISKAMADHKKTLSFNSALKLERDRLNSPEYILRRAKSELNMSIVSPKQVIYMMREDG